MERSFAGGSHFCGSGAGNETNSQTACPAFLLDDVIRSIIIIRKMEGKYNLHCLAC